MTPDEQALFLEAMADVQPLKKPLSSQWLKTPNTRPRRQPDALQLDNFLTTGFLDIVPVDSPLAFHREGVQLGVVEKLRLGKYAHQATLNLLRMPVRECRLQLYEFIQTSSAQGLRNLMVIRGRPRSDEHHANIVRSYLARWLIEFDTVQAYCQAQPMHGGAAACYVALKKNPAAKRENRERHAKRSR